MKDSIQLMKGHVWINSQINNEKQEVDVSKVSF